MRHVSDSVPLPEPLAPNDNAGFCEVFESCRKELFYRAQRLTRTRFDAEDLVQQTAEKAWLSWITAHEKKISRAWLHRIMYHAFIDGTRRKTCERAANGRWRSFRMQQAELSDHARGSNHDTWSDQVDTALSRLQRPARDVLLRVALQGETYDYVAKELNCPMGTVMSRLHRARRQLAQDLRSYALKSGYIKDAA